MYTLYTRRRRDLQDRYGYPTGKWGWFEWEAMMHVRPGEAASTLKYWRDLDDFAVRLRGAANTARQFKVVEGAATIAELEF